VDKAGPDAVLPVGTLLEALERHPLWVELGIGAGLEPLKPCNSRGIRVAPAGYASPLGFTAARNYAVSAEASRFAGSSATIGASFTSAFWLYLICVSHALPLRCGIARFVGPILEITEIFDALQIYVILRWARTLRRISPPYQVWASRWALSLRVAIPRMLILFFSATVISANVRS
jgi:hypothetical protein